MKKLLPQARLRLLLKLLKARLKMPRKPLKLLKPLLRMRVIKLASIAVKLRMPLPLLHKQRLMLKVLLQVLATS